MNAWALRGDGVASVGDTDLELVGLFAASNEAVSFDGHTGYAISPGPGPVDTTASFTVSAWVSYAHKVAFGFAVSQIGKVAASFFLGVGEGKWEFAMKEADGPGGTHRAQGAAAVPDGGVWVHLVGVHDAEAGENRLYVDGVLTATTPFSQPFQAGGPLTIGRSQSNRAASDFWPGAISRVAIYDTAITAEQITEIHETTKPASAPPPRPGPDPSTYADGILDGTWDQVQDEAIAQRLLDEWSAEFGAEQFEGVQEVAVRFGFDGYEYWQGVVFDGKLFLEPEGVPAGSGGTISIAGDMLTLHEREGRTAVKWFLDGTTLNLEGAMFPFRADSLTKSGDDPSF